MNWAEPIPIDDPDVSQVYYARLDKNHRRVWFRFTSQAGDRIWFQVGVPVLDRLRALVPRAVVVRPGLSSDGNPGFPLPPGAGAAFFQSAGEPRFFDEEFTGTLSWIWLERDSVLPADGTWYVVAWSPAIRRCVRTFHEVS